MSDLVAEMLGTAEGENKGAPPASTPGTTGDLVNDSLASLDESPSEPTAVQPGGNLLLKGVIEFTQKLGEAHEVGQAGFRESSLGHAVMDGRLSLDDAVKQIEADDHLAQLSGDLEQYQKDSAVPWLTGIAIATGKQLPMLEATLGVGAGAFGIAGGATAATGAGAPIAIPVGAIAGTAAAGGWTSDYITGQEYLDLRRKGVPHETAKVGASLSGIAQGILSGARFGQAAKVPLNTAKNILLAHAQNVAHFITQGVKFEAGQITLAEAQTATHLITDAIAGTVSKVPGAVPTLEEAAKEFGETFKQTLQGSLGLFLGGKAAGALGGLTGKTMLKVFRQAKDAHMANQEAKTQAIQEAQQVHQQPAEAEPSGPSKNALEKQRQAAERLAKRQAAEAEIRRIFDAAASKFYIEKPESRLQEANRVQRLLKRMVTNSDKLDDQMKGRLLGRIIEIDGVKDLLKHGDRFIIEQRGREHANDLQAAKDQLQKIIKTGQPKDAKAVLPAAAQASLKWYKEFFTEPVPVKEKGAARREPGQAQEEARQIALKKATDYVERGVEEEAKQLQAQVQKLENNELAEIFNQPAELSEKQRIAMQAQRYWGNHLDPAGIMKLAGEIEEVVKTGKSEFLERKQRESQRLLNLRARAKEGVNGIKPVVPSQANTQPKQMTGLGKFLHSLHSTTTALADKLYQDTPFEERQKLAADTLDFTKQENEESAISIRSAEKLVDLYTEAAGTMREANRLIRQGRKSEKFDVQYTDALGEPQNLGRASINQLAYLHIAFEDPGAVPGLVSGNRFTLEGMVEAGQTSTQEAVRHILEQREGGKYLKLAEGVRELYRWFAPEVANHYLKEYGVELPMIDKYSGQIMHRELERQRNAADLLKDVHDYAGAAISPGSTKARSNSKLPVKLVDPFQQVNRHRSQMAFWIANSEKARETSFIFSDTSQDGLRDVIEHKQGREMTSLIDSRIAWQFHLKPGLMDIADGALQSAKSNMATGLLGARIDQAPKQWTSVLATLSTNSPAEMLDGLKGAADKSRLQEYLSRSDLYKDRQNHILPQVLGATKDPSYADALTGDRALAAKQFFLTPMHKWGDGVAAAVSGFIEFNRALKGGATPEEAALAGDRLVDSTQSSSRPSQKVPAEFKGGVANLSLSFMKEGIQAINRESGAIRDFFIHKDKVSAARVARVIVATHVAQAIFQSINSIPAWVVGDDREKNDAAIRIASAAISGPYSSLPLIGWDAIAGALSGFRGQQEPRTIIGSLTADSVKLVSRTWEITRKLAEGEDIESDEWMRELKSVASTASSVTGIPFWGLFKYTVLGSKILEKATGQ